jgi:hypothetical protein
LRGALADLDVERLEVDAALLLNVNTPGELQLCRRG